MNLTDKDFTKRFKLYFSSLFARMMPKVVIGCPGLPDNVFLYTNIKKEEMEYYEADSEYFIHKVELKDTEFFEDLIERFDLFKKATFLLYADKFLSAFNKHVGPLSAINVTLDGEMVVISVIQDNNVPLVTECGELISETLATQYKRLFDENCVDPLQSKQFDASTKNFLDAAYSIVDLPFFSDRLCKAVLVSNKSGVSLKEFPTKANLVGYTYVMSAQNDGTTVRMNTQFDCPDVKVTSVQPHMVWFTKPINNKEEKHE